MKKINLSIFSELSQVISAVAVVISLVYLASEINQNTKATKAAMRQAHADNAVSYLMSYIDNSVVAVAAYKHDYKIELSDLEKSQLKSQQHINFRLFENAHYQYNQGLIEFEDWNTYQKIMSHLLKTYSPAKEMWLQTQGLFSMPFQNEVDKILKDNDISLENLNDIVKDTISAK